MDINIGGTIRVLRKENKLTQEQLAEKIGVSFQAVSKWENSIALPDIALLPKLAQIFGVSIDKIFSYSTKEIQEEIDNYCWQSYELRETDPQKGRAILEEALQKYPDNDILLNNLLYCINYSENPDETIQLASKLIDITNESDIKYDALRFLAYAFNAKGDNKSAVSALEQIPEIYFTKLSEMAFITEGQAKYDAAEKQKWLSFETLIQMMWKLAEFYRDSGDIKKALLETQTALNLITTFSHEEKISRFNSYTEFFNKKIQEMQNRK